ncbi:MAG: hypothetical protein NT018_10705 [Armatimonadetes bacterium]|nr:hypothetical protein [Armatimonadota bacterium]
MSTNAITSTSPTTDTSVVNVKAKTMDQDSFLKLLIVEMQNQDPLSPMDNKDSIAQLAQFTSLQQMQQLNQNFKDFGTTFSTTSSATQAYSLTGNWVDYKDPSNPDAILTGRVENVSFENGVAKLKVGTSSVDLASITKVYPSYVSVGQGRTSAQAISMIDQTVNYIDPTTEAVKNGKVAGVSFVDGWPKLSINGASVDLGNVLGVSGSENRVEDADTRAMAEAMNGKNIEYRDISKPGTIAKGWVKGVNYTAGMPQLMVNNTLVDMSNVIRVYRPT